MKKALISLLILFSIFEFSYSENIFSLSLSSDIGITDFKNGEEEYSIFDIRIKFGFDYKYIIKNGFMFGAQITYQPDIITLGSPNKALGGTVVSYTGMGINLAPIIGYRFGNKHLFGIELLPIIFSYTSLNGDAQLQRQYGNNFVEQTVSQSGNKIVYSTELRANFQFGNNLVRNGFILGIGIPWFIDLSSAKILNLKTKYSNSYSCSGVFLEVGYKLSFVK